MMTIFAPQWSTPVERLSNKHTQHKNRRKAQLFAVDDRMFHLCNCGQCEESTYCLLAAEEYNVTV